MANVWTRLSGAARATLATALAVTALAGAQSVSPTPAAAVDDVCATAPTPPAANVFISCWDTTEVADGTSDVNSIALPLADTDTWGGTYNFTVEWGDGSSDVITDWAQAETTHTYATPGRYWLQITGTFSDFSYAAAAVQDGPKLITVSQWGGLTLGNRGGNFFNARNMNFTATDAPDLSQTTNLNGAFQGALSFNSPVNHWDVSTVTSMYGTFAQAPAFNQPLSTWNTSNVTTLGQAFEGAAAFNQDLSNWNTSNVTSMFWTFFGASSFNNGGQDLTWDVSNVTVFGNMFEAATSFNQPIGDWQIGPGPGISMHSMFHAATSLNQDLSGWDMSGVSEISSMFKDAHSFNNGGQDLTWDTDLASVTNLNGTFRQAYAFNQPIGEWDVSAATDMSEMFVGASSFSQDLSGWSPTSVVAGGAGGMASMFDGSALSTEDYDAILIGWAARSLASGLTFGASTTAYSPAAVAARAELATTKGWIITDLGVVSASVDGVRFPDVEVGRQSQPLDVVVTNTGAANVGGPEGPAVTGADAAMFLVFSNTCTGVVLSPAETCSIRIIFRPTSTGPKSATIEVAFPNPATSQVDPLTASLTGTALAPDPSDDVVPVDPDDPDITRPRVTDRMSWRRTQAPRLMVLPDAPVAPRVVGLPAKVRLSIAVRLGGEWVRLGVSVSDARGRATLPPFQVVVPGAYTIRAAVVGGRERYLKVAAPRPPV